MGAAGCCISTSSSLTTSDWISIIGMIINSGLAIWIVWAIQNRLTNRRVLKDHFINEIKEIRNEYKSCLNNLYLNSTPPKSVIPWFKLMNIKVDDLMTCVYTKYKIDKKKLVAYQDELRELVTENEDFIKQYKSDKFVFFSEYSRGLFIKFQQEHNYLFNEIIININDAK